MSIQPKKADSTGFFNSYHIWKKELNIGCYPIKGILLTNKFTQALGYVASFFTLLLSFGSAGVKKIKSQNGDKTIYILTTRSNFSNYIKNTRLPLEKINRIWEFSTAQLKY